MRFYSPMRYPGGKAKLAPFLQQVIEAQETRPTLYAEPYAGGAGAAFALLCSGAVERIALNDLNDGIASLWRVIFGDDVQGLTELIRSAPIDIDHWHLQREIYLDKSVSQLERAFATLFLNRTNRSGILGARPIGGLSQTGAWRLGARFNRESLIERIETLATQRERVSVHQLDGKDFLATLEATGEPAFAYVDPPYLTQGEELYMNSMTWQDHEMLSKFLRKAAGLLWVLTYDHDERVPNHLYPNLPCASFSVSHTAARQHVGWEYLVVPIHVRVNRLQGFGPRDGAWLQQRSPSELAAEKPFRGGPGGIR